MIVQVLSDLNLIFLKYWKHFYPINCDILCLCGNIGNPYTEVYWDFIKYCKEYCKYVLIITGNLEYHENYIRTVDVHIKNTIKNIDDVIFLKRNTFCYGGYNFIGCTLWGNIPNVYKNELKNIHKNIYNIIVNDEHLNDSLWLQETINESKNRNLKVIVLSHYSPILNTQHNNTVQHYTCSSDMTHLYKDVDMWCFGNYLPHKTDPSFKVDIYKTLFVSNNPTRQKDLTISLNDTTI